MADAVAKTAASPLVLRPRMSLRQPFNHMPFPPPFPTPNTRASPVILDVVLAAPRDQLRNVTPPVAQPLMRINQCGLLLIRPCVLSAQEASGFIAMPL